MSRKHNNDVYASDVDLVVANINTIRSWIHRLLWKSREVHSNWHSVCNMWVSNLLDWYASEHRSLQILIQICASRNRDASCWVISSVLQSDANDWRIAKANIRDIHMYCNCNCSIRCILRCLRVARGQGRWRHDGLHTHCKEHLDRNCNSAQCLLQFSGG